MNPQQSMTLSSSIKTTTSTSGNSHNPSSLPQETPTSVAQGPTLQTPQVESSPASQKSKDTPQSTSHTDTGETVIPGSTRIFKIGQTFVTHTVMEEACAEESKCTEDKYHSTKEPDNSNATVVDCRNDEDGSVEERKHESDNQSIAKSDAGIDPMIYKYMLAVGQAQFQDTSPQKDPKSGQPLGSFLSANQVRINVIKTHKSLKVF